MAACNFITTNTHDASFSSLHKLVCYSLIKMLAETIFTRYQSFRITHRYKEGTIYSLINTTKDYKTKLLSLIRGSFLCKQLFGLNKGLDKRLIKGKNATD